MVRENPFFPDIRRPLRFPHDLLRILYWAYARPFTLERYLQQFDPTLRLTTGLLTLWRRGREHPPLRHVVVLTMFHALITPWLAIPLIALFQGMGIAVDWFGVLWGMLVGVLGGVSLAVLLNVLRGVSMGALGGVLGGVLVGVLGGVLVGVLGGVLGGMLEGMLGGVSRGVVGGVSGSVAVGILLGMLGDPVLGVLAVVLVGMLGSVAGGVLVGMVGGVLGGMLIAGGTLIGVLRLYEYPLWLFWALALALMDSRGRFLAFSPPFWHEVIPLPLPGLLRHLLALARRDREAGLAAIAYLSAYRYPWARRVAREALTELILDDMAGAQNLTAIASLGGQLAWLPPEARAQWKSLLAALETVAGAVRAGLESDTAYNRALRYREALRHLRGWQEGLRLGEDPLAPRLLPILADWEAMLTAAMAEADRAAWLPNPYIPGSPLAANSPVFAGRKPLFAALERELAAYAQQRPALLLFGARRMGKSSTLNQFPVRLGPGVVPLKMDGQGLASVESNAAFLRALMQTAVEQAYRARAVELPEPDAAALAADPFDAFLRWLDAVERRVAEDFVFLLAMDEYESLEAAIRKGRLDERVLDLLRHLLQERSRWLVLLSGLYTFDLLPDRWADRFINLRVMKIGPLTPEEARELIFFPDLMERGVRYDPEAVDRLISETGGQPNWLQAALKAIVERLDRERRLEVTPDDVKAALEEVPRMVPGDFRYIWRHVVAGTDREPAEDERIAYQRVLAWVAAEPGITADELRRRLPGHHALVFHTLIFYHEREMLIREGNGYRWAMPLLSRWLRDRAEAEGLLA